jgi:competence ComEA-like helix-hairpin-helix protein
LPPLETVVESEGVAEEEPGGTAVETPGVDDLPEWLRGIEDEIPAKESEPIELATEVAEVPPQEEAGESDDEAAFAWLEGLASRQGAEEALLLNPEERTETPPEWVVEALAAGAVVKSSEDDQETGPGDELPTWMKEISPEAEVEESKAVVEEEIPAWLKQPVSFEETNAHETPEPAPLAPDLPPWLADVEKPSELEEAPGWVPPVESPISGEAGLVQETLQAEEIPSEEEMPPHLDLNEAGLVDLERVPGIGFVKAQAILDYRQEHGRFEKIDDLINIAGITPEEIDGLRSQIEVNALSTEEGLEQPRDEIQVALLQARNALVQGNISAALGYYQSLISSSQMLPEVIQDLNEALYRFPVDVEIWQSLGDAHVHSGHLQDALDAYTKAEEYLR